jgi:hypothetical protein
MQSKAVQYLTKHYAMKTYGRADDLGNNEKWVVSFTPAA